MGRYYDRRNPPPSQIVRVKFDPTDLTVLQCGKTPDIFIRDLIERGRGLTDIVIHNATNPISPTGNVEMILVFTSAADIAAISGGLVSNWFDCDTQFVPVTLQGATTMNTVLRVLAPGTLTSGVIETTSLLV